MVAGLAVTEMRLVTIPGVVGHMEHPKPCPPGIPLGTWEELVI
jgi:hypothetical protein